MSDKNAEKIGAVCFWTGLMLELLIVVVEKSAYTNPLESQLFRLTFLLFCIKIALTKYSKGEWLAILLTGAILFVSYLVNERDEAVRVVAFVAACKGMDVRKVMKAVFWTTLAGCVALMALSVTGIYGAVSVAADYGRGGMETRYTLGMGHPNALHCMLWLVVVLAVYCNADRMKWYHYAAFFAMDVVLYTFTKSMTGVIVWALFLAAAFAMRYSKTCRENRAAYLFGAAVVLGCIVFSMMGSHIENTYETPDSLMHRFDKLLNGRYQSCYAVEAARLENWKLFASPENTEYFDAGFVRLFYWYGIIPGMLYIGMNFYLLYQGYKKKDAVMLVMIVSFSIYNLMEAHFISEYLLRNYLLVLMGHYWYQPFEGKYRFEGYFWQVRGLLGKA
ncbi:MAG: hypothetical protein K1W36_21610 [Lachnospiraceae bacterium]|jgi:hypothetical protein|nr:hypothetical protein [Lachnospiraceae bacterium]